MSGKAKDGSGMPFVNIYKNIDVTQVYDKKSMINENKKFIGITRPDFTKVKTNPPAAIHHQLGNQMVMMNFSEIDTNLLQYIKFFSDTGTAFRLKPDHLRYFEKKIPKPRVQEKKIIIWSSQDEYIGWRLYTKYLTFLMITIFILFFNYCKKNNY